MFAEIHGHAFTKCSCDVTMKGVNPSLTQVFVPPSWIKAPACFGPVSDVCMVQRISFLQLMMVSACFVCAGMGCFDRVPCLTCFPLVTIPPALTTETAAKPFVHL